MKTGAIHPYAGLEADKENQNRINILNNNKKDIGGEGKPLKPLPNNPPISGNKDGPMDGPLMTWTKMLESLHQILSSVNYIRENPDIEDLPIEDVPAPVVNMGMNGSGGDDELLNDLNQIFTPILVMQGFETDIADKIQEAFSEASVLTERNVIQFDDSTRMAQLIAVCALLIARQKNTQQYQMYKKGAEIQKNMKLEIQKSEYAAARALAQKYLVKVSTTNNSSIARQFATNLLPETQH